jgi:hypothetical protein
LEKAAFEQKTVAIDLEEIHRAGGGASRAEEMDLHGGREWEAGMESRVLIVPQRANGLAQIFHAFDVRFSLTPWL